MSEIQYIDRVTKQIETEQVYGRFYLELLYGCGPFSWLSRILLVPLFCRLAFFSRLYGNFQKSPISRKKIKPFIEKYRVDATEFLEPVESFASFNDFFIRKLKPSVRPIVEGNDIATLPADGRYLVYPSIQLADGFLVKGKKFCLEKLLGSKSVAHKYAQGAMVIARLCPVDYHRFHFPCDGVPSSAKEIPGHLYSVNPLALKRYINIFAQNKRMITELHTKAFGTIMYIEIGATYVGSIHQTFVPQEHCAKGDEKGYFSFGGSCLVLLFEPFRIQFDEDLIEASKKGMEVRGLLGQSLGRALSSM